MLLAVYSNECCELCDGEGGAGGALEVVLAAPSDCIDAPWVRARVEVGPAGARVAQAQGLAEGEATELLAESLREALDVTCAEPPGVWLAVLSALSERLDARAASAAGACDDGARQQESQRSSWPEESPGERSGVDPTDLQDAQGAPRVESVRTHKR